MNEADTRAELIEPQLRAAGWGVVEGSFVRREFHITAGKIQPGGVRAKPLKADYVLEYKNRKLATVEAKPDEVEVAEGVMQAKLYAGKMELDFTYAANGREIYEISMRQRTEGTIAAFPTPDELWQRTFGDVSEWQAKFNAVPFEYVGGSKQARYYQEIAVNRALTAIANNRERVLLTLATGTGKTFIAFQIAWKLFQSRWNLQRDGGRRPRILFLADRNILADQAYNAFEAFGEDARKRIRPGEISATGQVPTNASVFFTIFQTFMSGPNDSPYFGQYPPDFFDLIVIDECHRGGANDESTWRAILDYFSPAVQIGLTATPKRDQNVDTYEYFGEPVYVYSLKDGIADGFLTPFKVRRIWTTLDEYRYVPDDKVLAGEVEADKVYSEGDFNRIIVMQERERKRVRILLDEINQSEKTLVFGATQQHAAMLRDLINQNAMSTDPFYCVRVAADDGEQGEQYLREFQDNEKTVPTILTTSQKLSTGVDALNIRHIALMRPVNTMIEFKQIIGRGTRLYDGKDYFTIYDFVGAYHHFADPEWDGEPIEPEPIEPRPRGPRPDPPDDGPTVGPPPPLEKLVIRLADGKERHIQHMASTSFLDGNGNPISAEQFLENLFGVLPELFKDEDELRRIWSVPSTRRELLQRLADAGYGRAQLAEMQKLIDAENSDVFDVLEFVAYAVAPITRAERAEGARSNVFPLLSGEQRGFLDFVLSKYVESGVEELDEAKLPHLIELKYQSIQDGVEALGEVADIRTTFIDFQKHLYQRRVA